MDVLRRLYDGVLPIKDVVFSIPEKAVRLLIITDFIYLQIIKKKLNSVI